MIPKEKAKERMVQKRATGAKDFMGKGLEKDHLERATLKEKVKATTKVKASTREKVLRWYQCHRAA